MRPGCPYRRLAATPDVTHHPTRTCDTQDMSNAAITSKCSCGETESHIVARRQTADGIGVEIWHDGAITGRMGLRLQGVPVARPRTEKSLALAQATAALFSENVAMYDAAELPRLYVCAKAVATRGGASGDLRNLFNADDVKVLHLTWDVRCADRDGTPTLRVAVLDRIRWPGLAIWNERGRYEVMAISHGTALGVRSHAALVSTGVTFDSQRELTAYLFSIIAG